MLVLAILATLLLCLAFGGGQYRGYYPRARQQWLLLGCLLLIAWVVPNGWVGASIAWFVAHVLARQTEQGFMRYTALAAHGATLLGGLLAVGVLLHGQDTTPLLWAIGGLSVPLLAWSLYSQVYYPENYRHHWGWFCLFEDFAPSIQAGLGNLNHTEAVTAVLAACALGLVPTSPWAWGLVVCAVIPLLQGRYNRAQYRKYHATNPWFHVSTQGDIYLLLLTGLWVAQQEHLTLQTCLFIGLSLLPVFMLAYWQEAKERLTMWWNVLQQVWWRQSWAVKLLGCGPRSWARDHWEYAQQHKDDEHIAHVWTHAHSEYVQTLYEYGVVGLVLLGGALVSLLTTAQHPTLLNVGIMLCVVAALQSPWVLYHELRITTETAVIKGANGPVLKQEYTDTHGSPLLNLLSGLWVVLVLSQ